MTSSSPPRPERPSARGGSRRARDAELARLAKALGHPARVAILRMLIEKGDCQCGAIVERLPLAQATVSQHLGVLKEAGLIHGAIDPPRICYCVDLKTVRHFRTLIRELDPEGGSP